MRTGLVAVGLTFMAALHAPAREADKVEQYRGMLLNRPENAVLFGRLVDAWLAQGEMAGLKELLEAKAAVGSPMDWRLLAVFRSFSGDEAGAITALDEALKNAPEDAQTRLARAKALGAASRFEDALADLGVAAKDATAAMEAGTLRGKFLARAGRPQDAVKAWQEVIAAHPGDEGLREDLIELEIGEGMLDEAVAAASELAEKSVDPYQKALRQMRVAEILAQAGRKNEAVEKYRAVFAVSAESSWLEREVLARVNALFSREDDTAGLRAFYDQLRETYPRRVVVKKEAARILMASGEGDESVAMFREVLKVLPGDREARDEFIALLEGAGRFKDAADEVAALLVSSDKDLALWEKMAGIRKQMGDEPGLKEAVDKAVALVPESEAGRISAAAIFERYGRSDDAERVLRDAVKTHGLAGEAGDALAMILAGRGKPDEAVGLWREMAKTADREGLLRIVRSLTANGRAADAYGILSSRIADFPGDPLLMASLCQSAQFADQSESAIPQALALIRQAKTSGDLETALRQAISIVFRAKEPQKWIDELAAVGNPSTQELCLLAEMRETLGDSIEADRILKKAMEGGDPLLAAAQRVRLFELRGDFDSAIVATRDWLALPGGLRTEQVKRLVNLHERSGDIGAALKETENWKRLAPGDKLVWSKRAGLFLTDGKPEDAVAELRRALAKFGAEEEMRASLASALTEAGMAAEAWRVYYALYDEAESPASKLKWAGSLAELAAREGREEDVLSDFKRRSRDNPSSVVPLLALAEMYREWQQPEEEHQAIAEASRRKPDDVALLQRLADIEELGGSGEKAEALLKTAIRLQDTPENRRRLSAFWIRGGDSERGLAELLATKGGASPRDTEKLVMPLAIAKDWDAAVGILATEVPRHPDDWRLAYLHASALREAGRKDEAFTRFAALLDAKGDLPGVMPLIPANQMQWMVGNNAGNSDFRLFSHLQVVTSGPKDRRRMYYGANQAGIPMPGTPTETRWMALCQALSLVEENPGIRTAMLAVLTASDFAGLEFIKSVHSLKPEELRNRMTAENPDPRLFRWYLETMNWNTYEERAVDFKLLRRGLDVCLAKDPEMALMLMTRLPIDGENGLGEEGSGKMLALISALDADKRAFYLSALQKIAFADEKQLSGRIREQAEQLMLGELKAIQAKNGNTWTSDSLALHRMRVGRFEDAVSLLNESYEFNKNAPAQSARNSMISMYGRHGLQMPGAGGPLAFPAILASSVNQAFLSEFNIGNSNGILSLTQDQKKLLNLLGDKAGGLPGQDEPAKPIELDGIAKVLSKIADPILRVFFAQCAGKPELVEREISSLITARANDSKALCIAAAYELSVKKDSAKAYGLLSKAVEFAKADDGRDAIDWHLYQLGLTLSTKPPEGLDLEPARRAALRLRKPMARDEDSKRRLAADMAKLGIDEEGKRYIAAPKPIIGLRSPFGYSSGGMSGRSQQGLNQQALTALVGQGNREAAARRAISEIRRLKASAAARSNSNYEERRIYDLIVSLKLEDEIIRVCQPSAGAGFNRRREFAMLLTQLKKMELALPVLRELAKAKPDDFEVRSALLLALPKEERKGYILTLSDGKIDNDRIGNWFCALFESNGREIFEDYISNVGIFVLFLEKLEPSFDLERNLSWVNYTAKDLFNDNSFGDLRLKSLTRSGSDSSPKFDEAKSRERDDLARRLHEAMLRHPQTSEQGFILMFANREALQTSDETLDKSARTAVSLGFRMKPDDETMRMYGGNRSSLLWMWRTSGGGSSSSGEPEGGIDPMTYLIRHSAEGNSPFSPEFIAQLAKDDSEQGRMFLECLKIIDSPGLAAFTAWREKSMAAPQEASAELIWISRLAYFKKRGDLLDSAVEFACDVSIGKIGNAPRRGSGGLPEVLSLTVSDADGLEEKTKVIDRITKRLLGPPEAWTLYGDLPQHPRMQSVQARLGIFQQFCQSFQSNRASMVALARFVAENGIIAAELDISNHSNQWRGGSEAEVIVKDWCESGMFSPGPAPAGSSRSDGAPLIEAMESIAGNYGSDMKKKIAVALLKTEGADRFWARFLGARFSNTPAVAVTELEREARAISKWQPRSRESLARTVVKWFPEAEKTADGGVKRLLAESRKQGDSETRKLAESYLKDGFPQDMQPYSISNSLGSVIRRLIADDPSMAVRLWTKALEHFKNSQNGFSSSSGGFNRSAAQYANSELLQSFANGGTPAAAVAEFVVLLETASPGATSGMFDSNSGYYLRQVFDGYQRLSKDAFVSDKSLAGMKAEARPFAGFLLKINKDTLKQARPIMANLYLMNTLYQSSSSNKTLRPILLDWTRKDLRKLDPDLANAAILSLNYRAGKDLTDADKLELRDAFCLILKDVRVPLPLRVNTVASLLERISDSSWLDDAACSNALADMLVATASDGSNWASSDTIQCFTRFAHLKTVSSVDAARVIAAIRANPPATRSNGSNHEVAAMVSRFMLPLALRAGDKEEVSKLVKGGGDAYRGNLDFVLQLWQENHADAAVSLIARPGEYHQGMRALLFSTTSGDGKIPYFTRGIEPSLTEWLAAIADPAQRFRVECVISSALDAKGDNAPAKKRSERIDALVKRFSAEAPKPRISRNEVLAVLGNELVPAKALASEYSEAVGKQSLGLLLPLRDGNSSNSKDADSSFVMEILIRRAMQYSLEDRGEVSLAVAQFESINPVPNGNQEYYASEMLQELGSWYAGLLVRHILGLPAEKRAEPARQALAIAKTLLEKGRSESKQLAVSLSIASQAAAGDGAALERWLAELPAPLRESYDKISAGGGLRYVMASLKNPALAGKDQEVFRRALLSGMLTDSAISKRVIRHATDISTIMDSGSFSRDDIFAVIDALPENYPRRAEFLCEKAGIIGWRGGKAEDALLAYDAAEAAAGGDAKVADFVKSYRVMFLDNKNRLADALVIARTINLDNLAPRERKTVEGVLKKPAPKEKTE